VGGGGGGADRESTIKICPNNPADYDIATSVQRKGKNLITVDVSEIQKREKNLTKVSFLEKKGQGKVEGQLRDSGEEGR